MSYAYIANRHIYAIRLSKLQLLTLSCGLRSYCFVDEGEDDDLFGESWFEDDSDLIEVERSTDKTPPNLRQQPKALTPGNYSGIVVNIAYLCITALQCLKLILSITCYLIG